MTLLPPPRFDSFDINSASSFNTHLTLCTLVAIDSARKDSAITRPVMAFEGVKMNDMGAQKPTNVTTAAKIDSFDVHSTSLPMM